MRIDVTGMAPGSYKVGVKATYTGGTFEGQLTARRARGGRRAAGELAAMASGDSARAAVVHGH
ncbi:hypothetical protein AB0368_37400, partial [Actinoplanes sp. NPDC051475]|uniref:hypothetical protein n=1 Tax=Actinoplanes sp. NPDC051475 TaxID=3157225 RepID=UPI00344FAB49